MTDTTQHPGRNTGYLESAEDADHGAGSAPSHTGSLLSSTAMRLHPLGVDEVRVTGGYWQRVHELNRRHIIRHCLTWIDKTGWTTNFDLASAGDGLAQARRGPVFSDATVYKVLEAMAWEVGRSKDQELESAFVALTSRVLAAQEADGYLNTSFGRQGQPARYSALEWGHELYCFGHFVQAGIARARTTTSDDPLFLAAVRAADHVCRVFGPEGRSAIGGHPEIEVALVELARTTGRKCYLDQARLFVDRRGHGTLGHGEFGPEYFQDATPVREQTTLVGHAVRALYLAAGAVDVAIEDNDEELLEVLVRQMRNADTRRTYVTGGVGSRHEGESFGDDYELPSDRAYSETCAGVGSMMVHHRLMLATSRLEQADAVERALYNVVLASPSEDGEAFFYTNTLHKRVEGSSSRADEVSPRASSSLRAAWFGVSCCPPNVARTIASLASYAATTSDHGLQIHQYVDGIYATELGDGGRVDIRVTTSYPADGTITLTVEQAPESPWDLTLRIPSWAIGATAVINDVTVPVQAPALVIRAPRAGSSLTLTLPVVPRWTAADPRIDAIRDTVAIERGPLVMCVESLDIPSGRSLDDIMVVPKMGFRGRDDQTCIPVVWRGEDVHDAPYRPLDTPQTHDEFGRQGAAGLDTRRVDWIPVVPYQRWANRGPSTMRVWLPVYRSGI